MKGRSETMGTYGLDGVILAWKREKLTNEQAIGQILLILRDLEERIRLLEQYLERKHRPG
jgi:hypothetical protein